MPLRPEKLSLLRSVEMLMRLAMAMLSRLRMGITKVKRREGVKAPGEFSHKERYMTGRKGAIWMQAEAWTEPDNPSHVG